MENYKKKDERTITIPIETILQRKTFVSVSQCSFMSLKSRVDVSLQENRYGPLHKRGGLPNKHTFTLRFGRRSVWSQNPKFNIIQKPFWIIRNHTDLKRYFIVWHYNGSNGVRIICKNIWMWENIDVSHRRQWEPDVNLYWSWGPLSTVKKGWQEMFSVWCDYFSLSFCFLHFVVWTRPWQNIYMDLFWRKCRGFILQRLLARTENPNGRCVGSWSINLV